MKFEYVVLAVLALFAMNCGGDNPAPQDPSSVPAASVDAGVAAPAAPADPAQPNK